MPPALTRREPVGRAVLWFGVASGPSAWTGHLLFSYALVPVACATNHPIILHAMTALCLLLTLAGALVAHRSWQRTRRADAPAGYPRFMALSGLLLNALFGYALVLEGLPVAFLSPCW